MGSSVVRTRTYPYDISPVPYPSTKNLANLDLWCALEFLRVEALLRSNEVCRLYEETFSQWNDEDQLSDSLFLKHGVFWGWHVLEAAHHSYLHPAAMAELDRWAGRLHEQAGISDLQDFFRNRMKMGFSLKEDAVNICERLVQDGPRYLWVRIDAAQAPHTVLGALEERLKKLHETLEIPLRATTVAVINKDRRYVELPYHPRKPPPIRDLLSWLKYFRCYDLRTVNGLSYGQIAQKVYKTTGKKAFDQARKAVSRVEQLISYAASATWPPPPIK